MRTILTLLAAAGAALSICATATANLAVGVSEDNGKVGGEAGAAFFSTLKDLGVSENRMAIRWDPANPTTIPDQTGIDLAMPLAALSGVHIVFAVFPAHAKDIGGSAAAAAQFASFLQLLARTYPQVKEFVVGNEPNQPRFWQPQYNPNGSPAAPAAYEGLLAKSYDALKAVDPGIAVIGLGLSPRGNDDPSASDNVSTSPVRFLRGLGAAYRASGRTAPLMDELAFHPYPNTNSDPLSKGYAWPNAGAVNLDRIKQAVWDAFAGTAQPTFAESGRSTSSSDARPMLLDLDETGWQVAIPTALQGIYFGKENVPTVDESTQAGIYGELIKMSSCDSTIRSLSFFHLMDERDLDRFQTGLVRADGTARPSYESVKSAISTTGGRCVSRPVTWRHTMTVTGAAAQFGDLRKPRWWRQTDWNFVAGAREEALFRAAILRVPARGAALRALASRGFANSALTASGTIKANLSRIVRFPAQRLRPGRYVFAIRLRAAMNPTRTKMFVSRPFQVGRPARKKR